MEKKNKIIIAVVEFKTKITRYKRWKTKQNDKIKSLTEQIEIIVKIWSWRKNTFIII